MRPFFGCGARVVRWLSLFVLGSLFGSGTLFAAGSKLQDLRTLVKMTVFWETFVPDDSSFTEISIFRNGLLHYDETGSPDTNGGRGSCPNTYVFSLGSGTRAQLAALEAALAKEHVGNLVGDCSLPSHDPKVFTYELTWISDRGDRANHLKFFAGHDPIAPPPPPPCGPQVQAARDAILAYVDAVMALHSTRTVSGLACYP